MYFKCWTFSNTKCHGSSLFLKKTILSCNLSHQRNLCWSVFVHWHRFSVKANGMWNWASENELASVFDCLEGVSGLSLIMFLLFLFHTSQCSSTCAGGFQRRVVVCQDENGYPANSCDESTQPIEQRSCESGPCPQWFYGSWSEVRIELNQIYSLLFKRLGSFLF